MESARSRQQRRSSAARPSLRLLLITPWHMAPLIEATGLANSERG